MKILERKDRPDRIFNSIDKRGHNFLPEKTILKSNLAERNSTSGKRTQTAVKPRITWFITKR